MPADLAIACACGTVRGVARAVSAGAGNHLVCYCDDCQTFARWLGRAEDVLDSNGGTEVYQMSPARLELTAGLEHLRCVRLTPRGILRWYADCCKTPIGNTLPSPTLPFMSLIGTCLAKEPPLDEVLGPVRARINARYATGDRSALNAHQGTPLPVYVRVAWKLLLWRLRGDHERSPLFDEGGAPVVQPSVARSRPRSPEAGGPPG